MLQNLQNEINTKRVLTFKLVGQPKRRIIVLIKQRFKSIKKSFSDWLFVDAKKPTNLK